MSEKERRELSERLNKGLKESFRRMIVIKQKLGQSVVTCDADGNPITVSAEEAWELARKREETYQQISEN